MTDDPSKNSQPPEDEDGWAYIWDGAAKAKMAWSIIGPVHAVVSNWKALAAIGLLLAWLNKPEIANALATIFGARK